MDADGSTRHRQVYGVQEIAREIGVSPRLVATWRQRGSHAMPEPDEDLAAGAVWLADRIEPWIAGMREGRSDDRPQQILSLLRVLARRTFRLAVELNEDNGFRAGTIRYLTLQLAELREDARVASLRSTSQPLVSPGTAKALFALEPLIAEAATLVESVPRRLWNSRDVTELPPKAEQDLVRLRQIFALEILPRVTDIVRHLERDMPRLPGPWGQP